MPELNQKGFAHLLLMVLLVAGVGLGVYLVGQKTQLFPWAASNPVSAPVISPTPSTSADSDGDGFSDSKEVFMGTDRNKACGVDAWPVDVNNDTVINGGDMSFMVPYVKGTKPYSRRYDLNQDSKIDEADTAVIQANFLKTCGTQPTSTPTTSQKPSPTPTPSAKPTPTAGTPQGLGVTSNSCALGNPEVSLSWSGVLGVNGYNVYRKYSFQNDYSYIGNVSGANNIGFVDTKATGIVASSKGSYRIVSGDNNGQSDYSNVVYITTLGCVGSTTPPAPQGLRAESTTCKGSNAEVSLNWSAVGSVNGYNIYRRYDFQNEYNYIGTTTTTSFADAPATGIVENATGYYRVVSGNNSGQSGYSNTIQIKSANCP